MRLTLRKMLRVPLTRVFWTNRMGLAERYLSRCLSRLSQMEDLLDQVVNHPESLKEIKSHTHTLRGSTGIFGFEPASQTAAHLDGLILMVQKKDMVLDAHFLDQAQTLLSQLRLELLERRNTVMRGEGKFFIKPVHQWGIILPSLVVVFLSSLMGYVFMIVVRSSALNFFQKQGLEDQVLLRYLTEVQSFFWIFLILVLALWLWGIYWSWRVSFWVFGPLARLERQLTEILDGKAPLSIIKTRQSDALFKLMDLVNQLVHKKSEK